MAPLRLLLPLLVLGAAGPGCIATCAVQTLSRSESVRCAAEVEAVTVVSGGAAQIAVVVTPLDGQGEPRRDVVTVPRWPLRYDVDDAAALRESVRVRPVKLGHGGACAGPILLGPALFAAREYDMLDVEVREGEAWRVVTSLPVVTRPPGPLARVVHAALLPLAFTLDVALFPLELGANALAWVFG